MGTIDLRSLVRRLGPHAARALESAAGVCVTRAHYEVTVEHLLAQFLDAGENDWGCLSASWPDIKPRIKAAVDHSLEELAVGNSSKPVFHPRLLEWIREGWLVASLELGEESIRSGALFMALVSQPERFVNGRAAEVLRSLPRHLTAALFREQVKDSHESKTIAPVADVKSSKGSACARFCEDFTQKAREGRLDPVLARDREVAQMIDILARRRKNNPILVGEAGVGKTAVVEGLALKIVQGEVPAFLKEVVVLSLDLGLLQAGAGVKGEFENRLKSVVEEIRTSPRSTILFIDEAHTLIGAGGPAGGGDAANLLKPVLARGELRTIAATTWAEYKKYFEKDAALARRFQPVKIDEPSVENTVLILRGLKDTYEKAHGVTVKDEALSAAAELSRRFLPDRQLPDKAVDLLDTAAARVKVRATAMKVPPQDELPRGGPPLLSPSDGVINEFPSPLGRRCPEGGIRPQGADEGEEPFSVDADVIAQVVSDWTGIPLGQVLRDETASLAALETQLEQRIRGQGAAIGAIARALRSAKAGLAEPGKPLGIFLCVGPSGVGKTETALAVADQLFGGERSVVTLNMTEFQESHSVSRLIGSPPGYVGFGEGGMLTEAVRRRPYSVVLIDEAEKAHRDVMNLFYQVFDKGVLSDSEGRQVDFKNTAIFLTSNLAAETIVRLFAEGAPPTPDQVRAGVHAQLVRHFPPALLARMTVVPYAPLAAEDIRQIVSMKLSRLAARALECHKIRLSFDEEATAGLAERCLSTESGARTIDHLLQGTVVPLISQAVLDRLGKSDGSDDMRICFTQNSHFTVKVKEDVYEQHPA